MWKSVVRKMAEGEDNVTCRSMTCFVLPSSPWRCRQLPARLSSTRCSKTRIQLQPCCVSLSSPKKQFLWHLPSLLTSEPMLSLLLAAAQGLHPAAPAPQATRRSPVTSPTSGGRKKESRRKEGVEKTAGRAGSILSNASQLPQKCPQPRAEKTIAVGQKAATLPIAPSRAVNHEGLQFFSPTAPQDKRRCPLPC